MRDLAEARGGWPDVYQPAEDSHLLARTAREYASPDDLVVDVGTGTGYVAAFLRDDPGATVVGIDRNPHACEAAREEGIPVIRGNLVDPIDGGVDLVVANPPYLPAESEAGPEDWLESALTAGETGRAVIEALLATVERVLAPGGQVLLVASSLSGIEETLGAGEAGGLSGEVVERESHPFETLCVCRFERA
jgi:release factor glutamine methyltransferase